MATCVCPFPRTDCPRCVFACPACVEMRSPAPMPAYVAAPHPAPALEVAPPVLDTLSTAEKAWCRRNLMVDYRDDQGRGRARPMTNDELIAVAVRMHREKESASERATERATERDRSAGLTLALEVARGALRPEVAVFAQLMEAKLRANDHKDGWRHDEPDALLRRLREEAEELDRSVDSTGARFLVPADVGLTTEDKARIGAEAADVANFAMMIADVCGALGAGVAPRALTAIGAVTGGVAACTCGSGGHPRRCHVHPDRFGQHCWELGICATFDTLLPALAEGQERDGARKFWNALVDVLDFPASDAAALRGTPGAGEAPSGLQWIRDYCASRMEGALEKSARGKGASFDAQIEQASADAFRDVGEHASRLLADFASAPVAQRKPDVAPADLANALQDRIHPASGGIISSSPVFRDQRRPAREVLDDIDELCERTRTDGPTSMSMGDAVAEIRKLVEADRRGEP